MKKISFKFIALAMALSICFSVVYSDYTYAIDLPKFVYDDEKTWQYNAINMISIGCAVGGLFVGPMTPWGTALEGTAVISDLFLRVMDANGWGDKPKEEQEELMKDYLKTAVTYNSSTKQYNISDSFNDDLHIVVNNYLKEITGYHIVQTITPDDVPSRFFKDKNGLANFKAVVDQLDAPSNFAIRSYSNDYASSFKFKLYMLRETYNYLPFYMAFPNTNYQGNFDDWYTYYNRSLVDGVVPTYNVRGNLYYLNNLIGLDDDWNFFPANASSWIAFNDDGHKAYDYNYGTTFETSFEHYYYQAYKNTENEYFNIIYKEKVPVKVWKNLEYFKDYDLGKQPYYSSQEWNNYDYSQDNSQTYSESFIDNSIKDSNNNTTYNEIVNNTTNGMTESDVAHLIETIMKNQRENNNNTGNDNGSGSGGSGSSGGSGLGALLDGIGSIFDFIGTLIGNIIGFIADLLKTTMDSISSVTGSLGGLGDAFASVFSFLPPEVIGIITGGLSLMITLAIIKFLLK